MNGSWISVWSAAREWSASIFPFPRFQHPMSPQDMVESFGLWWGRGEAEQWWKCPDLILVGMYINNWCLVTDFCRFSGMGSQRRGTTQASAWAGVQTTGQLGHREGGPDSTGWCCWSGVCLSLPVCRWASRMGVNALSAVGRSTWGSFVSQQMAWCWFLTLTFFCKLNVKI